MLSPGIAIAQQEVVSTFDEIVIVGTRRQGRTAIETAVPVDVFNQEDLDSISSDDMLDTMHEYQGIGLAAPQVHESLRLFVAGVDDSESSMPAVVMINPEVAPVGAETEEDWEGCLSIPDLRGRVVRPLEIRVRALDRHGIELSMTASGFPARVIQHETDHLDGILFVDRMRSFESLTFLSEYGRYWEKEEAATSKI